MAKQVAVKATPVISESSDDVSFGTIVKPNAFKKVVFSGAASKLLPSLYDLSHTWYLALVKFMTSYIEFLAGKGYNLFSTALNLGSEMVFAEAVLALKAKNPEVVLNIVLPFKGYDGRWMKDNQARFARICSEADVVCYADQAFKLPVTINPNNQLRATEYYLIQRAELETRGADLVITLGTGANVDGVAKAATAKSLRQAEISWSGEKFVSLQI